MHPRGVRKVKTNRTHILGACLNCRRRHVKCDQVRPSCLTCQAIGATCEGFTKEIQWITSKRGASESVPTNTDTDGATPKNVRSYLYTEQMRSAMTTTLTSELRSGSVNASLSELDARSKDNLVPASGNIAVGPFGVLNLGSRNEVTTPVAPSIPEQSIAEDVYSDPWNESEGILSNVDSNMTFVELLQWGDLFDFESNNHLLERNIELDGSFHASCQEMGCGTEEPSLPAEAPSHGLDGGAQGVVPNAERLLSTRNDLDLHQFDDALEQNILAHAPVLLKVFNDRITSLMSALVIGRKGPWKNLMMTSAIQALGEINYLGASDLKHARKANLFGIIASSAYHLAIKPPLNAEQSCAQWKSIADTCDQHGKAHLQASLRTEMGKVGKAKYKDQLMAILSMIAYSIISGQDKEARCYILDAERLLRFRGLAKRQVSHKARVLHHVYTWIRILSESTYVLHDHTRHSHMGRGALIADWVNHGLQSPEMRQASEHSRMDDFLRFEPNQSDSDLEIDEPKGNEVGLQDIHLEDSRMDANTMYRIIYGIPETWLSLVSQTTRLANSLEILVGGSGETGFTEIMDALQRRATRLENMVCMFAARNSTITTARKTMDNTSTTNSGNQHEIEANDFMISALSSALVIFFYRRIRDVNPWILQSHVDDVIRSLQSFDEATAQIDFGGVGTAWPAFMAGCEAMTTTRRDALLNWVSRGSEISGFQPYRSAKDIMASVWERRDHINSHSKGRMSSELRDGEKRPLWVDVCRAQQSWPILC